MGAETKNRHRPPIAVIGRVVHELIVERQLGKFEHRHAVITNGVSRLQTNEPDSTCRPSCHSHTPPPSWSKACPPARSGGVYDHHHRVYHGLILRGRRTDGRYPQTSRGPPLAQGGAHL